MIVSTSEVDLEPNVAEAVGTGCQFILTVGYELAVATDEQAVANPDLDFAIVDEFVDQPNVKPIVFDTAQAAFLAGYLAAGVSQTGKVATFGGGNQPPVTLFMDGFVDGVAKYNEVHGTAIVALGWDKAAQDGVFTGDFEDINKGLTTTQAFIDQGADVILPVAGQVGEGSARAALESGKALVIWVDSDGYDTLSAEYRPVLLTSVLKNTGDAVVEIVEVEHRRNLRQRPVHRHARERRRRHRAVPRHRVAGVGRTGRRDRAAEGRHHRGHDRGHEPEHPAVIGRISRSDAGLCRRSFEVVAAL